MAADPRSLDGLHLETERPRDEGSELFEQPLDLDSAFESIVHNSPDHVMLLDRDASIRFINRTVPDLTIDQVLGTPVYNYVPEEYREDMRRCFARVLTSGEPDRYETAYVSEDGDLSHYESRVGPVIRDGEVVGFAINSSNVTERRQAAADRDRFFSLSRDMLCVAGTDGYFKRLNNAFEATLGYRIDELLSRPYIELVHPDDQAATRVVADRLTAGEQAVDFENRYLAKDGQYRWLSWRAVAELDRGLIYAVARDVTERKSLEAQLLHSQKMDAVGQLAGGIAHDFNNLILAIQGNSDFALDRAERGEEVVEHLTEIKRAAQRAADLTRQLLAFSRRQPTHPTSLDLNGVTCDLMKLLRRLIPESIELDFAAGPECVPINADPGQMEQVIVNLCVNGRDAMPEGGKLRIETDTIMLDDEFCHVRPWARPGAYAVLRVSDTGNGIPYEVRERLFEPFFTTKEPGKGTGLGLATVYGIVQQHEGFLNIESEPGSGTVFEVYFPLAVSWSDEDWADPEERDEGGCEVVLVAEDDDMVRSVVVQILEDAGYDVLTCGDGEEALEVYRRHEDRIALVLLDMIMPKKSGPEVLVEIRAINPEVAVVFTSGYSSISRVGVADIDPVPIVQKPYRPRQLLQRVRQALER